MSETKLLNYNFYDYNKIYPFLQILKNNNEKIETEVRKI